MKQTKNATEKKQRVNVMIKIDEGRNKSGQTKHAPVLLVRTYLIQQSLPHTSYSEASCTQ